MISRGLGFRFLTPPPSSSTFVRHASSKRARRGDLLHFKKLRLAIVGRPNVGKSTIFNRLVRKSNAIVSNIPGTTRDRRDGTARLGKLDLELTDTGGFEDSKQFKDAYISGRHGPELIESMLRQTSLAVKHADLVLFTVDAKAGVTPEDEYFAKWIRRERCSDSAAGILLIANKAEGLGNVTRWGTGDLTWEDFLVDCNRLGFGTPIALSAEQGQGLGELYNHIEPFAMVDQAEAEAEKKSEERDIQVAMIGRPNVGKSTLLNTLIGSERVITGPIAGLTRDAIKVEWTYNDRKVVLVDTAGIRRNTKLFGNIHRSKKSEPNIKASAKASDTLLEQMSISDSLSVLGYSQVIVFIIDVTSNTDEPDANGPLTKHDLAIIGKIVEEGRAFVVAANKCDLSRQVQHDAGSYVIKTISEQISNSIPGARGVPVVPISALTSIGTSRLMETLFKIYDRWNSRIPTNKLNNWLRVQMFNTPPPAFKGTGSFNRKFRHAPLKMKYMTQVSSRPPTFVIKLNRRNPKQSTVPESYTRFLKNRLKEDFDLDGIPIRIIFRGSTGNKIHA